MAKIEKHCPACKNTFSVRPSVATVRRCCSVECQSSWKRSKRQLRTCETCSKKFEVRQSDIKFKAARFCSRECTRPMYSALLVGNTYRQGKSPWNKGGRGLAEAWNKGKKNPASCGAKNCNWRGEKVGYSALHKWLRRHLGTPDTCINCKTSGLSGKQIHWANKSRQYKRDFTDWLRLCAKCHSAYDRGKLTLARIGG